MPVSEHEYDDELDIDYSEIERQFEPTLDEGFEHVLVIDNLPIVDAEKKAKLLERLCSQFKKLGVNAQPEQIILPWDDAAASSKGFAFYVLPNANDADFALRVLDQTKFGKNILHFNRFSDVERFANVDPEWVEPQEEPFAPKAHLKKWLADPQGRDQYLTLRGTTASVFWNGRGGQSEEVPHRDARWGDYFLSWSTLGTYLASTHVPGVALWGGERFQSLCRFSHPHVALIDFSPCENYLVTCSTAEYPITVPEGSPQGPSNFIAGEDDGNHIAVWDIKSGRLLRTFPGDFTPMDGSKEPSRVPRWPALKWSPDDKYVGRLSTNSQISVYAAPSMELVDKKSIKLPGVQDFAWCPLGEKDKAAPAGGKGKKEEKENCFAFWLPEVDNQPARVTLMAFPSRNILRSKNLFNVSDCKLHWHDQGDYLCVKVDRHTKTKKSTFCNLEIFRMREKNYPVEVIELKDAVLAFAWEPKGDRFGFISCSDPNPGPGVTPKYNVAFYQIDPKKGDFRMLSTMENKATNRIFWSPRGRQVVLAAFESSQKCDIEFWDVDFTTDDKKTEGGVWGANVKQLGANEHYGMTELSWDPSGRYIATHATSWRPGTDSGFALWDIKGQQLKQDNVDSFKQFLWRPRPATSLPKDEQKKIRKNLREYARQFDEEDAAAESQGSAEVLQLRRRLVDEWNAWHAAARKTLLEERHASGIWPAKEQKKQEDLQAEVVEEWIEEVIDEKEEIVA